MTAAGGLIFPLARVYAEHAEVAIADDALRSDLESRLSAAGIPARSVFVFAALFVRCAAPLLLLGKPGGFGGLSVEERETLLARLQFSSSRLVRGLFLGIKPLLTGLCYGPDFGHG